MDASESRFGVRLFLHGTLCNGSPLRRTKLAEWKQIKLEDFPHHKVGPMFEELGEEYAKTCVGKSVGISIDCRPHMEKIDAEIKKMRFLAFRRGLDNSEEEEEDSETWSSRKRGLAKAASEFIRLREVLEGGLSLFREELESTTTTAEEPKKEAAAGSAEEGPSTAPPAVVRNVTELELCPDGESCVFLHCGGPTATNHCKKYTHELA